jgi:WD repeat-containing protein 24
MCAMLALVAPEELQISQLRVTRFLDSYIGVCVCFDCCSRCEEIYGHLLEILTRLRLHTCAAYLRKYCENEEIRKFTVVCSGSSNHDF